MFKDSPVLYIYLLVYISWYYINRSTQSYVVVLLNRTSYIPLWCLFRYTSALSSNFETFCVVIILFPFMSFCSM